MPDIETRQRILMAAIQLIGQKGLANVSMNDIVEASGVSKGGVYWYFKSKEEIITAISQRLFATDIKSVESLLEAEGTVSERLQQLIRDRVQGLQEMSGVVAILFEFYAVALHQDGVRQFIKAYFQNFHELLVALIQQGIERGEFRPVDALAAATALDAVFEGLIVRWLIDPDAVQWASLGEAAIRLTLDGLKHR